MKIKSVIRGLKKRMGFDEDSIPQDVKDKIEIKPKPKKAKKVVEEVVETEVEKLERELEELKKEEAKEEIEEVEEQPIEPKRLTTEEILLNHEQRILQMEAKWFRLGGI